MAFIDDILAEAKIAAGYFFEEEGGTTCPDEIGSSDASISGSVTLAQAAIESSFARCSLLNGGAYQTSTFTTFYNHASFEFVFETGSDVSTLQVLFQTGAGQFTAYIESGSLTCRFHLAGVNIVGSLAANTRYHILAHGTRNTSVFDNGDHFRLTANGSIVDSDTTSYANRLLSANGSTGMWRVGSSDGTAKYADGSDIAAGNGLIGTKLQYVGVYNDLLGNYEPDYTLAANHWAAIEFASSGVSGSGSLTDGGETLTGTGSVAIAATGSITEGSESISGSGSVAISASGSLSDSGETISGSGSVALSGSGSVQDSGEAISGTGSVSVSGSGTLVDGGETISGSASVASTNRGSFVDGGEIIAGTGSVSVSASGSLVDSGETISGSGSVAISGYGSLTDGGEVIAGAQTYRVARRSTPSLSAGSESSVTLTNPIVDESSISVICNSSLDLN